MMRITSATVGTPVRVPGSHGDLWTTAWADDGRLYTASDDTTGFGGAVSSNLAISRLDGDDPLALTGTTINAMPDYGAWGQILGDHAFWKANGLASIDGSLYLTVSRHSGSMDCDFPHQEAFDSTIVRSDDHGATWTPAPALGASMFPGPSFATPFFVDDGRRDGDGEPGEHVYAVSSDGAWNNGSSMRLGRVRRDRLRDLRAADWEFVQDVDHDGDRSPIWGPRHDTARSIFRAAGRASMTGIHYVAALGLYVLPQWHYPQLGRLEPGWARTRWELYQAPQPWGPWELFHTCDWQPQGFYNPWIVSRFTSDDGRRLWAFTAGDFRECVLLDGVYGLHVVPIDLEVDPAGTLREGPSADALREREQMLELRRFADAR